MVCVRIVSYPQIAIQCDRIPQCVRDDILLPVRCAGRGFVSGVQMQRQCNSVFVHEILKSLSDIWCRVAAASRGGN